MDRRTVSAVLLLGLAVLAPTFLTSCDKLPALSGINAYANCLKEGKKAEVVSFDALKTYCATRYQSYLSIGSDRLDGQASITNCLPEADVNSIQNLSLERTCSDFEGTLQNKTKSYIITSVVITIINRRTNQTDTKITDGLWIEPGGLGAFRVTLDHPFKRKGWYAPNDKFDWEFGTTRGFELDY